MIAGTTASVHMEVQVDGIAVYRISKEAMPQVFKRPFTNAGNPYVGLNNVAAAIDDLRPYRVGSPRS
ncbi:hypothetical protein [Cryobacterium fucosi]|uniref:Uncharacterized protein n=1 Tax=Cryobacterium fucosi TaxID=1259157 RepID=A0A4R9BHX6_9MICO|nr:hypothetical protein [Cryobacterium fucosi]TFD83225.1 hypothetical protein E3T48_00570 [Cryobacterium fucosi]